MALDKYAKKKGKPLPDGCEFDGNGKGMQHASESGGKPVFKKKNRPSIAAADDSGGEPGKEGSSGKKKRPYIEA